MITQSGGGRLYAVLAENGTFQLSVEPSLALFSDKCFLALRLRWKNKEGPLDPTILPVQVLSGGIDRSHDTLRATMMLNTGLALHQVGKAFSHNMAKKMEKESKGVLVSEDPDAFLSVHDYREDFVTDFGKLIDKAIGGIFPTKDFNHLPAIMTPYDLNMYMELLDPDADKAPEVQTDDDGKVTKVSFGKIPANED